MSAAPAWAMLANFSAVEGSRVSKYSPVAGACHVPSINKPKRRAWRSSHEVASLGSSGAGPYSMETNFSAMLMSVLSKKSAQLMQSDDDTRRNNGPWRDAPIAARCRQAIRWRQSETFLREARNRPVLLSSWRANRETAWQCEFRRQA